MDDQQQSRWQPTRRQLLWAGSIAVLAFLIIVVCGYLFGWKWTGLPKQTLWDSLELLIIPAVLAGVGIWFNRQQRERELEIAREQREREVEIADRRAQDEALQAYLDQIGQMLLDRDSPLRQRKQRDEDQAHIDEVQTLARARTLTVLTRLDGERKGTVVQFLYEAGLIGWWLRMETGEGEKRIARDGRVVDLSDADLSSALLS